MEVARLSSMGLVELLNHVANFCAPAFVVAGLTAWLGPWLVRPAAGALRRGPQWLLNTAAGLAVLLLGVWLFDQDGKMASYAALVLACASTQWLGARAWRTGGFSPRAAKKRPRGQ